MTDPALVDEALERAAEILAEPYGRCCQTEAERAWLAGWVEAIRALSAEHESRRFTQDGECGGESCTSCKAFDPFVKAMLGDRGGHGVDEQPRTEKITRRCCYAEGGWCPKDAEWELIFGLRPDDTVDSCDDHVWQLCTDAPIITIWSLGNELNFTLTRQEER